MKIILSVISFLCCFSVFAQEKEETPTLSFKDKNYIAVSIGKSSSKFRDFATSPLFYHGLPTAVGVRKYRVKNYAEVSMGMEYLFGSYYSSYNEHDAVSSVNALNLDYTRMHRSYLVSWEKTQLFIGGKVMGTAVIRQNPSLQNNNLGMEMFVNVMGSVMAKRDISRTVQKTKRFIFKYHLKPRKREIAYNLNLGIINSNYRNGYAYIGQSAVVNDPKLFDGYIFRLSSGVRINTQLDYTVFMKNNGLVFSYAWDALKTGNELDKFEMSQHVLKLSILLNK